MPAVLGLLVAALLLTGCDSGGGDAEPDLDLAGTWQLTEGNGPGGDIEPVDGNPITLTFDGDQVVGSDGCNTMSGTVSATGTRVVFGELVVTEMACLDENVMTAASAFAAAIGEITGGAREGDTLVLLGSGTELRFAAEQ